ncbi:hypothetical protein M5689_018117 [Euphorbia peplus]|nr:hypothetical protein M5689_018117 [Euphorbia peplus]
MKSNSRGDVSININKIAKSLKKSIETLEPLSDECCIYKVPPQLRELNKKMYTPCVVSIGPYHHGKSALKAMEEHKRRYLCAFLNRINRSMEEYIEGLEEHERSLHESYVEINGYNREKFMEIMAVDGAFVIEFLFVYGYGGWKRNDRIFGKQQLRNSVMYDLLLIENQLPFFYLKYLYGLIQEYNVDEKISLMRIVQRYLCDVSPWDWCVTHDIVTEERHVHHLLHFLIICLGQSERRERRKCKSLTTPTIWELHQAGVKFKPSSSSNCLSKINFNDGILEIPMLLLEDRVENIFRNMQAFEQCQISSENHNYIGDYISIMDMLINKEEDIKVLVQNGIIDNWLEDNHVAATVFNNLGKGNQLNSNDFYYSHVIEDLNAFCKIKSHKWKATLKLKYFNNPWTIISVIAAAILLILTIVQTVCSILQVS